MVSQWQCRSGSGMRLTSGQGDFADATVGGWVALTVAWVASNLSNQLPRNQHGSGKGGLATVLSRFGSRNFGNPVKYELNPALALLVNSSLPSRLLDVIAQSIAG